MDAASGSPLLPRVAIQFCTQCKWNLRAAYFAQELLSTFGDSLGEVALQPSTGGVFIISISVAAPPTSESTSPHVQHSVLWNRAVDGGFPETKELKRRVRDIIDPGRDLGHVDGKKKAAPVKDGGDVGLKEARVEGPEKLKGGGMEDVESGKMNTMVDVDRVGAGAADDGVKRNADGSVCEDCKYGEDGVDEGARN